MTMFRLPMAVWSLFITAILLLLAVPVLERGGRDAVAGPEHGHDASSTAQCTAGGGGDPLLCQHLFWFFGHPEVYIMILPAMGLVSEILPVFARKPLFGYRAMVFSIVAIGFLGFIVWGHHMFVSGMNLVLRRRSRSRRWSSRCPRPSRCSTGWARSGRAASGSRRRCASALAFVSMFVIGGLSGIFMASTPVDLFIHHTYFIVAHFHYVLFGGSLFALQAAVYFWFPKMFGRMMNEKLGYCELLADVHFLQPDVLPDAHDGPGGHDAPHRGPDAVPAPAQPPAVAEVHQPSSAFGLGASFFVFWYNFFWSMFYGEKAPDNPWRATRWSGRCLRR